MPDPDLEIGGGGEGRGPVCFWPFGPQFRLKMGGGGWGRAIPLDPPLVPIKFTSYVTSFAVSRVYH